MYGLRAALEMASRLMEPTLIADDEWLYRLVRSHEYAVREGRVFFSASAFNDRGFKPSVDRSALRHDPSVMKVEATDGVAKCLTETVRASCRIEIDGDAVTRAKGDPAKLAVIPMYFADAVHQPIKRSETEAENLAHSQVECTPEMLSSSRFKKLKEALARIATQHGFVVAPEKADSSSGP
jgi:hypothetical protein